MTVRISGLRRFAMMSTLAVALAGCAMTGGGDSGSSTTSLAPDVLSASEIRNILAGKSWRFRGPNNTGTTLYAEDGTSLVEVDGKGTTRGKWMAKDGQLCESFDPAPFLPGGVPMSCYPFSGSGGTYQAGKATFTVAS
ncbi:MAG: hypothetical protein KDK89_16195 [Alphaproteobacteria bacterium]|nr:hypothetical protein [Alphaproteobacteria bacterium]